MDVFSVFDSLTVASNGLDDTQGQVLSTGLSSLMKATLATGGEGRSPAGITFGSATNLSPAGAMPLAPTGASITPFATGLTLGQPGWSTAQPILNAPTSSEHSVVLPRTDHGGVPAPLSRGHRAGVVPDSVLDELISDTVLVRGWTAVGSIGGQVLPRYAVTGEPDALDVAQHGTRVQPVSEVRTGRMPLLETKPHRQPASSKACLTDILLAAGFCSFGAGTLAARSRRARSLQLPRRTP